MSEVIEKAVEIKAYPEDNRADIESTSADGMIFLKRHFDDSQKASIKGEQVNDILNDLRDRNLRFSFKVGESEEKVEDNI